MQSYITIRQSYTCSSSSQHSLFESMKKYTTEQKLFSKTGIFSDYKKIWENRRPPSKPEASFLKIGFLTLRPRLTQLYNFGPITVLKDYSQNISPAFAADKDDDGSSKFLQLIRMMMLVLSEGANSRHT